MKRDPVIDAILPVYRPDEHLLTVLDALESQSIPIRQVLILNEGESYWDDTLIAGRRGVDVYHIASTDRMPGTVWNLGAGFSDADAMLCLRQDAVPADDRFLARLLRPLKNREVKVSFARSVPGDGAGVVDGYELLMDDPKVNMIVSERTMRTRHVVPSALTQCGAALYDLEFFKQVGGFPVPCIGYEDVVFASRAIRRGFAAAYCGGAMTYRSRVRSERGVFRRAFDAGVLCAQHPEVAPYFSYLRDRESFLSMVEEMKEDGMRSFIPRFRRRYRIREAGYLIGLRYRSLSSSRVRRMSYNQRYWKMRDLS